VKSLAAVITMREGHDFETHERRLQDFLGKFGHPRDIVWTFHEDFVWQDAILYVNTRRVVWNRDLTKMIFCDLETYCHGLALELVATCGSLSICSPYAPRSELDAQQRMIADVKLSACHGHRCGRPSHGPVSPSSPPPHHHRLGDARQPRLRPLVERRRASRDGVSRANS
jgi:hypothetical protein